MLVSMKPVPTVLPKSVIVISFVLGLLSSVAFRASILFQKFSVAIALDLALPGK